MYGSTGNTYPPSPLLMRFLVRSWEYRRPRLALGIRIASGVFNLLLGLVLVAAFGVLGPYSALAVLPLAGSVLIFWTVRRLQASAQ